jgi:hypothetical protein
MHRKRSIAVLFTLLFAAGAFSAHAQVAASANVQRHSLAVGGLGSVFQPDYAGGVVAQTGPQRLYGMGVYVDFKLSRWVQLEAEARWLRFNSYIGITEDNYLIGPRLPLDRLRYKRATPFAKVLFGYGRITFPYNGGWDRTFDIAYGGGVDIKLTKRITLRAIDFEYQQWPQWPNVVGVQNTTLYPYGGSVGASYKIF